MKKTFFLLSLLACFALHAIAYDFQSGNLLYTIIGNDPPRVSLDGHVDGTAAQGELFIPEMVEYEGNVYSTTRIGRYAFSGCNALVGQLVIPNTVDTILQGAFQSCSGFTGNLVIPNSVHCIQGAAFQNCFGFDGQLVSPDSITTIYGSTFMYCSGLSGTLNIPNTVVSIGAQAFYGCSGFTGNLVIPNSVVELNVNGHSANTILGSFEDCTGFTGLILSNSLEMIDDGNGGGCFAGCTGITGNLLLPESLTYIGAAAFCRCGGLAGRLVIPNAVTHIGEDAFAACSGLSDELVVPNSVTDIRGYAFDGCGFSKLLLGNSIASIGSYAFRNNPLASIQIKAMEPPILGIGNGIFSAFENVSKDIPVYVPCGTEEAYRNSREWDEFLRYYERSVYSLMALSEDEGLGRAIILKEATCEDPTVKVKAIPTQGYDFIYWEANGERVSSENPYSFELVGNMELVARFSGTGLEEMLFKISLFPNPTTGHVTVTGKDLKAAEVLNILGQRVAKARGRGETLQIDMGELPAGVYFVTVTDEEGRRCVRKVVKE